ncbi:MAG: MFS transporter [Paracoccaceae bacterium]|nr:MFS transporter [Paracoccaceae bacterium]
MTRTSSISRIEFVALTAVLMSCTAYAIDSMLASVPLIGSELSPNAPERATFILTLFFLGVGLGTFIVGPLSDAFGRKPVLLLGLSVFIGGSAIAWQADSLSLLLAARFISGLGAATPRVLSGAIVRDLYQGRGMARILSFSMMVFTIVPGVAPLIGSLISDAWGWRAVFASIMLFALFVALWFGLRQVETLALENRRPMRMSRYKLAIGELFVNRSFVIVLCMQALISAMLYTVLMSAHGIFVEIFDMAEQFPYLLGFGSLCGAIAAFTNASLVMRLGMRRLIRTALSIQVSMSIILLGTLAFVDLPASVFFWAFLVWKVSNFAVLGFTTGNLQAIALGPFGHMSGMASSMLAASSTILAGLLSYPVFASFDGSLLPVVFGIATLGGGALFLSHWLGHEG